MILRSFASRLLPLLLAAAAGLGPAASSAAAGPSSCGQPATPISAIQGGHESSPLAGQSVEIEAVVTLRLQGGAGSAGFFAEEETGDRDRDASTSEGLFLAGNHRVMPGDRIRVRGRVGERHGLTHLSRLSRLEKCPAHGSLPAPAALRLPLRGREHPETLENMRVALPQPLVVIENRQLWEFGELALASARHVVPTQVALPGPGALARAERQQLDRLIVDDGRMGRHLPVTLAGPDNSSPFSAANAIRAGQQVAGLEGVLHFAFGQWRLQPSRPFTVDASTNPRPLLPPPVGGKLRVATFNLLNYFTTLDQGDTPRCGPRRSQACRGANSAEEFRRQQHKLVAALAAIDADIVALSELENDSGEALASLAAALNGKAGENTYAPIETGVTGSDAIRVGLIFKPRTVRPAGDFVILDRRSDPRFDDGLNRPALAQTFALTGGEMLTVIAVHLKSKSCLDAAGADSDQQDGQACFNAARTQAAAALAGWALSDPTGSGTENVLIAGDLNAYRFEDPLRALIDRGFTDLVQQHPPADGAGLDYSYVFDGGTGTLDYLLASPALSERAVAAAAWHINADEAAALDYNQEDGRPDAWFAPDAFRSSDHDPLIAGLDLGAARAMSATRATDLAGGGPKRSVSLPVATVAAVVLALLIALRRRRRPG